MTDNSKISTILKLARAKLGWSQSHLAEVSKVKQSQLSRYEGGKAVPRYDVAKRLADALDIDVDKIYQKESTQVDLMSNDTQKVSIEIPIDLFNKIAESARKVMSPLDVEIRRRLALSFTGLTVPYDVLGQSIKNVQNLEELMLNSLDKIVVLQDRIKELESEKSNSNAE